MDQKNLYHFIRQHKLAVLATVSPEGAPQSAVVGFAVTPALELVFDTLRTTRKYRNLIRDPRASLVIGWDHEITLQYEGDAEELRGSELERCQKVYFDVWPDGPERLKWPNITYFKVTPRWVRYSDFNADSYQVIEFEL
jgi:general stress protein 26